MSFDVFLARFEQGKLADAPRESVLAVLRARKYTGPDRYGFYVVAVSDVDSVEFSARGLESDEPFQRCAFHVRCWNSGVAEVLFDVAKAGRFAVVAAMEENPLILVEREMLADLPADMLEELRPVFVTSAKALAEGLSGGFKAWAGYRDDVVGNGTLPRNDRGGRTRG